MAGRVIVKGSFTNVSASARFTSALTASIASSPIADTKGWYYAVAGGEILSQPVQGTFDTATKTWTVAVVPVEGVTYRISAPGFMPDCFVESSAYLPMPAGGADVVVNAETLVGEPGGDTLVEYVTLTTVIASIDSKVATAVDEYFVAHPPMGGDLSGTYPNPGVAKVAGVTPSAIGLDLLAAEDGDVLRYLVAGSPSGPIPTFLGASDAATARSAIGAADAASLAPVATTGTYDSLTGTVPTSALPPLAINTVQVVATQAAMLALTAERGDMAIRTDTGRTYVLATDSPTTLADWKEVAAAGQVVSVAGQTGAVTLTKADVGLGSVDNTSDAAKPISTATATAISALAPKVNPALTATTPAPVLTTVTTPALSGWTLTGSATYSTGSITVGAGAGSLSTDIPVTNDTVYQIDLTTSASSGGDVTVTLGAASATKFAPAGAGITSVTVTATETGTRTLTISGATWSATITGVTVKALTRLSPAATIGAAEVRAWSTNTAVGTSAHRSLTTGAYNTGVGASAQYNLTTGAYNTAMGVSAQVSLTTGAYNTALGSSAQYSLTTGSRNTGVGMYAQYSLTTGSDNTGLGQSAQYNLTTGSGNTGLGRYAQYNLTTGAYNTAMGVSAQVSLTTGAYNTALGSSAQYGLTTGSSNAAVGTSAQYLPAGNISNATTTGSRQTSLGVETGQSVSTQLNDITTLGYRARAGADFGTAVGSGAHAAHLRSVALGSTTTTTADDQIMAGPRDVEITSATRGVILRSPNGTRYRVTVTDAGALTVSAV